MSIGRAVDALTQRSATVRWSVPAVIVGLVVRRNLPWCSSEAGGVQVGR